MRFPKWFLPILSLVLFSILCFAQKPAVPTQPDSEVYGVQALSLFPLYSTAGDYEKATGKPAPAFNPAYRPKYWFDATVDLSDPEADVCYTVARVPRGKTQPQVVQSCLPAFEASRVNIPSGEASTVENDPRARPPRDLPIRALLPNEALVLSPFGIRVVRLDKHAERLKTEGAFLPADRALLEAIARKLGVL